MSRFFVVSDDQYKAFINIELVCMFRAKQDGNGKLVNPTEIEIEFIGGNKTRLVGDPADHFLMAMSDLIPR
jgi:hypothetical protein